MTTRTTASLAAAALLLGTVPLASAQPASLSGRWTLNIGKSDYQAVTPVLPPATLDIQQDGLALTIKMVVTTSRGDEATEWKHTTDKKKCLNAGTGIKDLESTAWIENGKLVIRGEREGVSAAMSGSGEVDRREYFRYTCVDEYTVSADGQTLHVISKLETPEGERRMTRVFQRMAK